MVQHGQRGYARQHFYSSYYKNKQKKDTAFTFLRRQLSTNRTEGPEAVPMAHADEQPCSCRCLQSVRPG